MINLQLLEDLAENNDEGNMLQELFEEFVEYTIRRQTAINILDQFLTEFSYEGVDVTCFEGVERILSKPGTVVWEHYEDWPNDLLASHIYALYQAVGV